MLECKTLSPTLVALSTDTAFHRGGCASLAVCGGDQVDLFAEAPFSFLPKFAESPPQNSQWDLKGWLGNPSRRRPRLFSLSVSSLRERVLEEG